jgi:hypothetical protein
MIVYNTIIKKYAEKGEKTGWTFIEVPKEIAIQLQPNTKKSFRVKGKIDAVVLQPVSILPMREGDYILPLNITLRKQIKKAVNQMVIVQLTIETQEYQLNENFMLCLADEPKALQHFNTLTKSHRNYFSKWIEAAKTNDTQIKRIAKAVNALSKGWNYAQMIRDKDNSSF